MSKVNYVADVRGGKVVVHEFTDAPTLRDVYPTKVRALRALLGRLDDEAEAACDTLRGLEAEAQLVYNALLLAQKELDPQ